MCRGSPRASWSAATRSWWSPGLEALQRAVHGEQIETHVYGVCDDADYDTRLRELARGRDVVWHGGYTHDELANSPFHLAVMPSLCHETHGLVLDEVRMLGVPALVSDRGAYRERIGQGGTVFRAGDSVELGRLLDRAVREPDWLQGLRRGVTPPEPFERYLRFIEREYEAVIAAGPSTADDRFDLEAHLEAEHGRSDQLERKALEWRNRAETPR